MRISTARVRALIVVGLCSAIVPLSEPVFAAQALTVKRKGAVAVPEHIEQLAGQLAIDPQELSELATDGAIPDEWIPVLQNAFALADAVGYGLELNGGQRAEFAGQVTNTLVRIEREARRPRKASFAELVATVRADACQTIRSNLGESAATAAASLLNELTPLREHQ